MKHKEYFDGLSWYQQTRDEKLQKYLKKFREFGVEQPLDPTKNAKASIH